MKIARFVFLLMLGADVVVAQTVAADRVRLNAAPCTIDSVDGSPDKLRFVDCSTLTTSSATNLTLAPTGDLVLSPAGVDVLPNTGYTVNLGALSNKYLTLHAAELWVETLVAQNTLATIGGRVLVAPTNTLTSDIGTGATSIVVKYNNLANGDRVYLEANGAVEWMAITSSASGSGPYTYSVTRNLDGSGANAWTAGDAVLDTGTTGNGFLDLYSTAGVLSGSGPSIVGNVRTGTTYNNIAPRWAIGNLNGLYGYGATTYGAAFGDASATNVTVDATNGFRIRSGTTDKLSADTSGNLALAGDLSVGTNGVVRSGATAYGTGVGFWLNGGSTSTYTVNYLVVGGGGGGAGGVDQGGGGGAGGFRASTTTVGAGASVTVTVGAGGAGGLNARGSNGGDSAFGTIVSTGGGGGGSSVTNVNGLGGGSGGGGSAPSGNGGSATSGQGSTGGTGTSIEVGGGSGGGGGASASGGNGSTSGGGTGGNGGAGTASSITGSSVTYAGGGAGIGWAVNGTGGAGGGGNSGTDGTANTGGGGGARHGATGGAGGSGIVVISYTTGSITATGGTITTSGGNTIHTFTSSGTFTVTSPVPPKFRVGDPAGNRLEWDGSTLAITGTQIINGSALVNGTVTGTHIAAGTVTASNLSVSTLSAISANLGTVTAGSISGLSLSAGVGPSFSVSGSTGDTSIINATIRNLQNTGGFGINVFDDMDFQGTRSIYGLNGLNVSGSVVFPFSGGGNQYVCVNNSGVLYASASAC